MGSRTTDHSPFCGEGRCRSQEEENGGMRIEEVCPSLFLSYALGVSERSVRSEGTKGGELGLHRECQESGERCTSRSQKTRIRESIKYRRPPSMPGTSPLLLEKRWCTQQIRGGDWFSQSGVGSIFG